EWALRTRAMTGRRVPLISTLEGLVGTPERERQLTQWAGHPVHCQQVDPGILRRLDFIYKISDHVIAISPFLARMGIKLYGEKFSVHMFGVEGSLFAPAPHPKRDLTVINIASFQPRKRPEMFLELAARFPKVNFVWYGNGQNRAQLIAAAEQRNLGNLRFPGSRTPAELAAALQSACIFAIPSNSEGVPKVTQEAAACGLPIVAYGYYETPTVVNGDNGFVVWSDEEFFDRVGMLIWDRDLAGRMGQRSAKLARQWRWDLLAPQWEHEILKHVPV
ncbi:MAG: glycosyltransferase family 4 protein, partial [Acidobacteriaceae bacterium]